MLLKGEKYDGKPCVTCGGTLRYVKKNVCVACAQRQSKAYYNTEEGREMHRKANRVQKNKKYYGTAVNSDLVNRRRAAEERIANRELNNLNVRGGE